MSLICTQNRATQKRKSHNTTRCLWTEHIALNRHLRSTERCCVPYVYTAHWSSWSLLIWVPSLWWYHKHTSIFRGHGSTEPRGRWRELATNKVWYRGVKRRLKRRWIKQQQLWDLKERSRLLCPLLKHQCHFWCMPGLTCNGIFAPLQRSWYSVF